MRRQNDLKSKLEQIKELKLQICSKEQEINSLKRQISDLENDSTETEIYKEAYKDRIIKFTPSIDTEHTIHILHVVDVNKCLGGELYLSTDLHLANFDGYKYIFEFDNNKLIRFILDDWNIEPLTFEEYLKIVNEAMDNIKQQATTIHAKKTLKVDGLTL